MNLKEANTPQKLAQFIREREKENKPADTVRFTKVLNSMASQIPKAKRGTSRKRSSGS